MSSHLPPEPNFSQEGNHRRRVPEFEAEFDRLVSEQFHGQPAPEPTAEGGNRQEDVFGDAAAQADSAPFIDRKKEESRRVESGEPAEGEGV